MIDDDFVLKGRDLPYPIPDISLGVHCYEKLKSHADGFVLMIEAESGRECTSYEALQLGVNVAMGLKELGINKGDSVCLIGRNGIDISCAALGTLFLGGIIAPLDPTMKAFEYRHMFELIEPKLIVADIDTLTEIRQALDTMGSEIEIISLQDGESGARTLASTMIEGSVDDFEPEPCDDVQDLCMIVGSSGTTGLPKGVGLTHSNILFMTILGRLATEKLPKLPLLHTSHFFWMSGVFLFFTTISEQALRILVEEVNVPNVLKAIEKYKTFWTLSPPSLLHALVNDPDFPNYDLSSMGFIATGGSPLQMATVERAKAIWNSSLVVAQAYGLSELSGVFTAARPDLDIASVGVPSPGTSIKVVDPETGMNLPPGQEGEVFCKSYGLMKCYVKNPETTAECIDEEGWLHTGDLGYFTEEGVIYITGRIKELMKLDNHQIAPAEIEQVINTVPGVADVGVAGIKISEDSSHPMALVVKKENSDVSEEEIVKCVNDNLSEFKQLRAGICFVDSIPRTLTGKIKRRKLQELADQLYMGDTSNIL